jgi:hypothetical protein
VYIPTEETLEEGSKIQKLVNTVFTPPKNYFHLQNGGHVEAIKSHTDSLYFIHADIENFFGKINRTRITRSLKRSLPYKVARNIAVSSTVRIPDRTDTAYHLPYGYPQSTILASICLWDSALGQYLEKISNTLNVSVYVDDIIISGTEKAPLEEACRILLEKSSRSLLPFGIDSQPKVSESISAFNILLSHNHLEIEKPRLEKFRFQIAEAKNQEVINGILSYVRSVNEAQYLDLAG